MSYDKLSPAQKAWVCNTAKTVYLECRDARTGAGAGHTESVRRHCQAMPASMAAIVEGLAESVRRGELTLESLDTP
jgi:hypothetical protein